MAFVLTVHAGKKERKKEKEGRREGGKEGRKEGKKKSSASPLLLPNKASRFTKVYPAGPLSLPQDSFTNDYTTPTSKKLT